MSNNPNWNEWDSAHRSQLPQDVDAEQGPERYGNGVDDPLVSNNDFLALHSMIQTKSFGLGATNDTNNPCAAHYQSPPGASVWRIPNPAGGLDPDTFLSRDYGFVSQNPIAQPFSSQPNYVASSQNMNYQAETGCAHPSASSPSAHFAQGALTMDLNDNVYSGNLDQSKMSHTHDVVPSRSRKPRSDLDAQRCDERMSGIRAVEVRQIPCPPNLAPGTHRTGNLETQADRYVDDDGTFVVISKRIKHNAMSDREFRGCRNRTSDDSFKPVHPWMFSGRQTHSWNECPIVRCQHCPEGLDGIDLRWSANFTRGVTWKSITDRKNRLYFYDCGKKDGKKDGKEHPVDFTHLAEFMEWREGHPNSQIRLPKNGELNDDWHEKWKNEYPLPPGVVRVVYPGGNAQIYNNTEPESIRQAGGSSIDVT